HMRAFRETRIQSCFVTGHDLSRAENAAKSEPASQAAEKLLRAVGRGFIPGMIHALSARALAPEASSSGISLEIRPFSAVSLTPAGRSISSFARDSLH